MTHPAECQYELDATDRIRDVDDAWLSFACSQGASALTREAVLGRSVYDFIGSGEMRHLYALLLTSARRAEHALRLPFRCDSPETRRFMEMELHHARGGGVRIATRLLREESRPPVPLVVTRRPARLPFVAICSWCKRVRTAPGRWEEVEDAVRSLDLFGDRLLPGLTHGICDDCDHELTLRVAEADEKAS